MSPCGAVFSCSGFPSTSRQGSSCQLPDKEKEFKLSQPINTIQKQFPPGMSTFYLKLSNYMFFLLFNAMQKTALKKYGIEIITNKITKYFVMQVTFLPVTAHTTLL